MQSPGHEQRCNNTTEMYIVRCACLACIHSTEWPCRYRADHALVSPESRVWLGNPTWPGCKTSHIVSLGSGAHFSMLLVRMQVGSRSFELKGLCFCDGAFDTGRICYTVAMQRRFKHTTVLR